MTYEEMHRIIDEAVLAWHEVADKHEIKHCNCFREKFARKMIDLYGQRLEHDA